MRFKCRVKAKVFLNFFLALLPTDLKIETFSQSINISAQRGVLIVQKDEARTFQLALTSFSCSQLLNLFISVHL